ncbi:hypothetical protein NHH03_01710 [Stieleria sp. TO1_6]|uniref:hypothetical protein n=1 Tax=Stieleria tagensis TaxID=2956795 RepID=UPI00209A6C1D|nr:hypothetical protein [Stieleria tagensis]MCO8120436.1 hypothetical protein [Stieleria tagensis]
MIAPREVGSTERSTTFIPSMEIPVLFLAGVLASAVTVCWIAGADAASPPVPIESVDATTRATWLIDGMVIDAQTEQPIQSFVVTPGSLSVDDQGRSSVRWRANLNREMKQGMLQWPRTSGFSVMRFRITADGYLPVVTQQIHRGGPHTRMKLKLTRQQTADQD